MSKTLKNLALEVYNGKNVMFNEVSGEEAIKNAIMDAVGGELNFYNFQQNKYKVFEILSEVIELPMQQVEKEILPGIVKVSQVDLGDKKEIVLKRKNLLRVARIAAGTQDIRRQRLAGLERIPVETAPYGVRVYEELELLLSGRITFSDFVDSINRSFEVGVAKMVNKCFADAVDALSANYKVTGTMNEEELMALCQKVSARNEGAPVKIYGTKVALSKISKAQNIISESQKETYGTLYHFGNFYNIQLVEIAQMFDEAGVALVDDNALYVLPELQFVELCYEGAPIVMEPENANRSDMQIELFISQKVGATAIFGAYFGAYILA